MKLVVLSCIVAISSGLSIRQPLNPNGYVADLGSSAVNQQYDTANAVGWKDGANMTPYVRQTVEGFWQGVVPNYENPLDAAHSTLFASESEAKAWVEVHTGSTEPLLYGEPDLGDTRIDQVAFEGTSANNANYARSGKANEQTNRQLEHPIIDAELSHRAEQTYHDTWDHMSTINKYGTDHGTTKEIEAKKLAAKKAKLATTWSKAEAAREHLIGGDDKLKSGKTGEQTEGAKFTKERDVQRKLKYGTRTERQQDQMTWTSRYGKTS